MVKIISFIENVVLDDLKLWKIYNTFNSFWNIKCLISNRLPTMNYLYVGTYLFENRWELKRSRQFEDVIKLWSKFTVKLFKDISLWCKLWWYPNIMWLIWWIFVCKIISQIVKINLKFNIGWYLILTSNHQQNTRLLH